MGERRASGGRKDYLSNLPADASLRQLAAIKGRWSSEQAHRKMKEDLGLDHFEGRSWTGLHRHALLTMIAFAFLQRRRLNLGQAEETPPPASAQPARRSAGHRHFPPATASAHPMPEPPTVDQPVNRSGNANVGLEAATRDFSRKITASASAVAES